AYGRALAAVGLAQEHDGRMRRRVALDERRRVVSRAVVDDDDLGVEVQCFDALEHLKDRGRLVVGGDEKGNTDRRIQLQSRNWTPRGGRVDSSAMPLAREDRTLALRLVAAVTLFLLLVGQAHVSMLDGSSMLAVAQSVVH